MAPEIATDQPKWSPAAVSEPFSSAVWFQPVAVFVNTYTRPALFAALVAATTAVVPESDTAEPNWSPATVSEPSSSAACFQPLAVLVNTYARPALLEWPYAPTTAVVPETATDQPK